MHNFYNGDYDNAVEIFNLLLEKGYNIPKNSSSKFSFSLTKLRLLCLLYLGKYEEILEITKDWENDPYWSSIYGTYRASTFKRKTELKRHNIGETEQSVSDSLGVFDTIFKDGDYPIVACVESNKILKEFDFILTNSSYARQIISQYVSFMAKHYFNIVSRIRNESIDSKESKELLSKVYNADIKHNPLHNVKWYSENSDIAYDEEHMEELIAEGFDIVQVYHIPEREFGLSNYIFAKNAYEDQFYLHVDFFEGGWTRWGYIENDTKLAITFDVLLKNGKPTPATDIVQIDQYVI